VSSDSAILAKQLHEARAAAQTIDIGREAVASVDAAYEIQAAFIELSGGDLKGWKVTALTRNDQQKFGTDHAVAGALLGDFVHSSGSQLSLSSFVAPLIECEIAFLLGADLPPHSSGYSRDEVEAAISAVVPVVEFPDSRIGRDAPDLLKLADVMNNGALVAGKPLEDWRPLDLARIDVRLECDGELIVEGASARILGDPVLALLALANAYPLPAPLRAGQIVTTGTCTNPVAVRPGRYIASFSGLGDVEVRFTA